MDLVIDVGNTRAKAGAFDQDRLVSQFHFGHDEVPAELKGRAFDNLLYATVRSDDVPALRSLSVLGHSLRLTEGLPLPIVNGYATPSTLGPDRLAAACGARQLFPSAPCLIIDAGTSLTCDFMSEKGVYMGGAISPGVEMRFRALQSFTSKLPLVQRSNTPGLTGDSTSSCIQSGVQMGSVFEVQGFIEAYLARYPDVRILLTGGDAPFFEKYLKAGIFVAPNLVLIGLNRILQHNVSR